MQYANENIQIQNANCQSISPKMPKRSEPTTTATLWWQLLVGFVSIILQAHERIVAYHLTFTEQNLKQILNYIDKDRDNSFTLIHTHQ